MRQILKQYGRGSGNVLALKEIRNSPQWINAWINVLFHWRCNMDVCNSHRLEKRKEVAIESYLPCAFHDMERKH